VPNSQRQKRTNAPRCGAVAAAGAATGAATGSAEGTGTMGEAEAGKMLGTTGASPGGLLSRLPMFESSRIG